jgi:hypothetical protein
MSKPVNRNLSGALAKEQNDAKEKADGAKRKKRSRERATRVRAERTKKG